MTKKINCFKAYDARGKVPDDLNEDIVYRIGRAYADFIKPKQVAVGRDVRLSSDSLFEALSRGLLDSGVDVLDLGVCGTELVYFAAFHQQLDGGIMITASHNPVDYNGLKFVGHGARPISVNSGLQDIRRIAEDESFSTTASPGELIPTDLSAAYIEHLLGYLGDTETLKQLIFFVIYLITSSFRLPDQSLCRTRSGTRYRTLRPSPHLLSFRPASRNPSQSLL